MEREIKSISEAFSMQPNYHYVGDSIEGRTLTSICLEVITIGHECGDPVQKLYYVGRDENKEKIFQFLATSVNVFYK